MRQYWWVAVALGLGFIVGVILGDAKHLQSIDAHLAVIERALVKR